MYKRCKENDSNQYGETPLMGATRMRKQAVADYLKSRVHPTAPLEPIAPPAVGDAAKVQVHSKDAGDAIAELLQGLDLGDFIETFRAEEITADILRDLTDDDLKSLGLSKLGQRKRLLRAIQERG
jgi:hypothetical protein